MYKILIDVPIGYSYIDSYTIGEDVTKQYSLLATGFTLAVTFVRVRSSAAFSVYLLNFSSPQSI